MQASVLSLETTALDAPHVRERHCPVPDQSARPQQLQQARALSVLGSKLRRIVEGVRVVCPCFAVGVRCESWSVGTKSEWGPEGRTLQVNLYLWEESIDLKVLISTERARDIGTVSEGDGRKAAVRSRESANLRLPLCSCTYAGAGG